MTQLNAEKIERVLEWVKTCPFDYRISTMQTGCLHLKVGIPQDEVIKLQGFEDKEGAA